MAKSLAEHELEVELGLAEPRDLTPSEKRELEQGIDAAAKREAFLDAYRKTGTIKAACDLIGLSRARVAVWRKQDPEFSLAFDTAVTEYTEHLERIVHQRAEDKSDILLMFALKKRDPSYRENFKMEHSGEVAIRVIRYDEPTSAPVAAPKEIIDAQVVE